MQGWAAYMGLNRENTASFPNTSREKNVPDTGAAATFQECEVPAPSAGDSRVWWLGLSRSDHSLLFLRQGFTV